MTEYIQCSIGDRDGRKNQTENQRVNSQEAGAKSAHLCEHVSVAFLMFIQMRGNGRTNVSIDSNDLTSFFVISYNITTSYMCVFFSLSLQVNIFLSLCSYIPVPVFLFDASFTSMTIHQMLSQQKSTHTHINFDCLSGNTHEKKTQTHIAAPFVVRHYIAICHVRTHIDF